LLFAIYANRLIRGLSLALELSHAGLSRHHWRTAVIADRLAEQLNLSLGQRKTLVYAALLHDIGAAANWKEKELLHNLKLGPFVYDHCEQGYALLKDSPQLGEIAEPIRYHHDQWAGTNPSGLAGTAIPLLSRILHLADRLEVLIQGDRHIFDQHTAIMEQLIGLRGTYFDPVLVDALRELAQRESFWLDLVNPHYYENFFNNPNLYGQLQFQLDDVINIAEIFASIIDKTSRFTASHSRRVATVAAYLAKLVGFSPEEVKLMWVAGLLHDLGKLAVPNTILESPNKLTPYEFMLMKQHTYYTYRILEQIDGFETVAEWAAYHHETLDGQGYPFRISGEQLNLGSRIMAVADVFVALTEKRPYRKEMLSLAEVKKIMQQMVANNKIDGTITGELFGNLAAATQLDSISWQ